jgi:hypothetical protein
VMDKSSAESPDLLISVPVQNQNCIKCGTKVSVYEEAQWEEIIILNGFHGTQ